MSDDLKLAVRRARLKRRAQLRAELSFQHALERIDHRLDVQDPADAEIVERAAQGELPVEGALAELVGETD
jgi:hypothetical protein